MSSEKLPLRNTLVMKFGGTSVGSSEAMLQAVRIVCDAKEEWRDVIVVVSALAGVTNRLLGSAAQAAHGDLQGLASVEEWLRTSHFAIADSLLSGSSSSNAIQAEILELIGGFATLVRAIATLGEATPRALDAVASLGERMSVRLFAGALQAAGLSCEAVEASGLIITNDDFQNAHPDFEATTLLTRQRLEPLLAGGQIPVITGFIGATSGGVVTTLGRGGSDYSAAILGAVLRADEVWIWTDVDGVMTADPRLVSEARTLERITYSEIAELAYYGAKVVHPKTIRPVVDAGIGLRICNTFNPSHPGTRLVANGRAPQKLSDPDQVVKAVTAVPNQKLVTIEGRGMLGVPGVAARTFAAVASTGTSVPLITQASSEQSICFAVPSEAAALVVAALQEVFANELRERDIDRIWAAEEVTIVTVVGAGMRHTPGVAGRIFSQLGASRINVLAIAQGSSEVSISMVVEAGSTEPAVRSLHRLIVQ